MLFKRTVMSIYKFQKYQKSVNYGEKCEQAIRKTWFKGINDPHVLEKLKMERVFYYEIVIQRAFKLKHLIFNNNNLSFSVFLHFFEKLKETLRWK